VNATVNPGQDIEIRVERHAPGSYRVIVRRIKKGFGGVFSRGVEAVFWGIVATVLYETVIKNEPKVEVKISTDEVVIQRGTERVVVPRAVHDAAQNAQANPEVQRSVKQTIQAVQVDEHITEFGLTAHINDKRPLLRIPRSDFVKITENVAILEDSEARLREETARLVILKAWLNHAKRKWSFEWNGVPISAPIVDKLFLDKLERREFLIGAHDAIDAIVTFKQRFDANLGIFVNDPNSFLISRVIRLIPHDG
jgi:hypothetical protein